MIQNQTTIFNDIYENWNITTVIITIVVIFNLHLVYWLLRFLIVNRVEFLSCVISFLIIRNFTNFVYLFVNMDKSVYSKNEMDEYLPKNILFNVGANIQ
jgi:hypothetical protein